MPLSISKSKFLAGLQCPKLLWTHYNDRDAIPEPDAAKQAIFDTGHEVGDLAKQLYPDGVEVPWSRDLGETVAATRALLPRWIPIFEASFDAGGGYCRVDILVPVGTDQWDLYEVKSSTKVKDVNVADVAFQAELIEKSGLKLNRLYLMHIDNTYVRDGDIDPHGLFHAEDVTDRARALQPTVTDRLATMHAIIAGERPDTPIGEHCFHPYDCDPRPGVVAALRTISPTGTILAYNMQFERRVIRDLAAAFPDSASFLKGLDSRFQDLMTPFRRFWYYHPDQHGNCSIKAVLPVLTDSTYEGMEIAEGGQAQREFQRVVFGHVDCEEKQRVLSALRDYCRQDTQAMVDLLNALEELT